MKSNTSLFSRVAFVVACSLLGSAALGQAGTAARTVISSNVDLTKTVAVRGNLRPEALEPEYDRGALDAAAPMEHVFVLLKRSPEREAALESFLSEVNRTGSPVFHKWLTPEQLGRNYGPSAADVDKVTDWLLSQGLTVNTVYRTGTMIDVSGTAGTINKAFKAKLHKLEVDGVEQFANTANPEIPAAFAGVLAGPVSLNSFKPHTQYHNKVKTHLNPKTGLADPGYTFTDSGYQDEAVVPGDLKTIYNLAQPFAAGFTGQGQTIGLIEDTDLYATSDWTTFRSVLGLSGYTAGSLATNHPAPASGGPACTDPGVNADDSEAILDAEYASAGAPSAAIVMEVCSDTTTTFGGLIALQNLVATGTSPKIISISYGESEAQNGATQNAAYNTVYQSAAAEGVSVFVSSGDEGAASSNANGSYANRGITVSGFASTPYNVAVGGTDFSDAAHGTVANYWSTTNNADYSSALSYIEEMPWADSCANRILFKAYGFTTAYGTATSTTGFCNTTTASSDGYLSTGGGSGGPSNCATGVPANSGVANGTCAGYSKPAFQGMVTNGSFTGVFGVPNDGVRDIPDVSLFAANGVWGHYYPYCYTDPTSGRYGAPCTGAPSTWSGAGGTSFASPIVAAMQSLVNQVTGSAWGNPLPTYYNLGAQQYGASGNPACNSNGTGPASASGSCAFHDIQIGDIDVNCRALTQRVSGVTTTVGTFNCYLPSGTYGILSTSNSSPLPAYRSTPGWDFTTGLGTINAGALINRWNTVDHSTPRYQ